jgi:hypothetical protein
MATKWLTRSVGIALFVFVCAYIAFFFYCVLMFVLNPNTPPVPALIVGVPVAFVAAIISLIFSIARRNSN